MLQGVQADEYGIAGEQKMLMAPVLGSLPRELHRIDEDEARSAFAVGRVEREGFGREARDLGQIAGVERDGCR